MALLSPRKSRVLGVGVGAKGALNLSYLLCIKGNHSQHKDSDCGEEFVSNPRELRERKRKSREIAREMKNLKKLNESVKMILASLQSALEMLEHIPYVLFILGSSSKQPSAAFEVHFQGNFARCDHHERCFLKSESYTKSFSRKVVYFLYFFSSG